jgi:hypothetical protein
MKRPTKGAISSCKADFLSFPLNFSIPSLPNLSAPSLISSNTLALRALTPDTDADTPEGGSGLSGLGVFELGRRELLALLLPVPLALALDLAADAAEYPRYRSVPEDLPRKEKNWRGR